LREQRQLGPRVLLVRRAELTLPQRLRIVEHRPQVCTLVGDRRSGSVGGAPVGSGTVGNSLRTSPSSVPASVAPVVVVAAVVAAAVCDELEFDDPQPAAITAQQASSSASARRIRGSVFDAAMGR
jgi:hypothetical protein